MPVYDLSTFLAPLKVVAQTIMLGEGASVQNRTAGGEVLRSGGTARLWRGSVVLAPMQNASAGSLNAKLHALASSDAYFTINDMAHDGISFTAQINGVNADGRMSLRAAGANRVLRAGDYIGFTYNGRRALHQAVEPANANSSGVTGAFAIVPVVRTGWTAGAAVTVGAARCTAAMVPGSLSIGMAANGVTEGASFDWVQTLGVV